MNMFSITFLVFFIILLFIYSRAKSINLQNKVLLLGSYLFYAYWDWRFLLLLISVSLTVYYSAKYCNKSEKAFHLGWIIPTLSLIICKYTNFFLDSFYSTFGISNHGSLEIILPLGISFYTFLSISYVLDVKAGKINPEESFIPVALYIAFFPTVVSGPITKARDMFHQFKVYHVIECSQLQIGAQLFLIGCIKKFVLADHLGILVDEVYKTPLAFDSSTVWLAMITYSLQLYLDFAGYSDMAIGCSRALGFTIAENFNFPYLAKNISEFWKRWHMSLSSWLMEYFYIAIGGSRCVTWKIYRNLMLTMIVCGFWHGAAWNFVFWGAIHGILLCFHRWYRSTVGKKIKLPVIFNIVVTFFTTTFCWIFFRGSDMENIYQIFYRLFVWNDSSVNHMFFWSWIAIGAIIISGVFSVYKNHWNGCQPIMDISKPKYFFVFCMEILVLWSLMYTGNNPFAYAAF